MAGALLHLLPRGAPALYLAFLYQGRGEKLVGEFQSFTPAWSPDGRWIAFTSNRDGQSEIYLAAVDGGELRRLTDNRAIDVAPTWSPNGRTIAFTSDRTGAPQIYTMDRDGLNLRRVSFEGSYNDSPPGPRHASTARSPTPPGSNAVPSTSSSTTSRPGRPASSRPARQQREPLVGSQRPAYRVRVQPGGCRPGLHHASGRLQSEAADPRGEQYHSALGESPRNPQ